MPSMTLELKIPRKVGRRVSAGRRFEREFIGRTDVSVKEADALTLTATATPYALVYGAVHPEHAAARLVEIEVESLDGFKVWDVRAVYEEPGLSGSLPDDPLSRDPDVRWGGENELRPLFRDFTSPQPRPIVNSAGERFSELPTREFGELILAYARNEAAPDFAVLREYMHTVNSLAFTVDGQLIPPGYAKIEIIDCPKITEGTVTYYRVVYQFRFKDGGWNPVMVYDVGYNKLVLAPGGGTKLAPIVDRDGMPVRTPHPMDGIGGAAAGGPTATPFPLLFKFYEEKDFSVFNFT